MRNFVYNTGYFLKETKTLIRLNLLSNIFSILSTGLIFFIVAMVISGWWISNQVVGAIQEEAEINVYFNKNLSKTDVSQMVEKINSTIGVRQARLVDENEAYSRMEKILGEEAKVLAYLEDNPFSPFVEVKIQLEEMNQVLENLKLVPNVEHVRDNKEVLERIKSIAGILRVLGFLVVAAVSISTLVIISHIIRMGIYNNREQINTLRLLGAPEGFISFPFLMQGFVLTLGGGIIACFLAVFVLKYIFAQMTGSLPFIPLPPQEQLVSGVIMLVISFSAGLGIVGSIFGLVSSKDK